jgi:hypothetical protein
MVRLFELPRCDFPFKVTPFAGKMRRLTSLIVFAAGVVLGVVSLGGTTSLPGRGANSNSLPAFEAGSETHETRANLQTELEFPNVGEIPREAAIEIPPPTRSSFMANWTKVNGATDYRLDVSTSSSFDSYMNGYEDLNVGDVTGRAVTGLSPGTTYYYRVRAYDATGSVASSDVMTATTVATTGLTITPTFDSSITNRPNSAAIQAMINRAIGIYETLFSDPLTIRIRFRYATTAPNGTPLPQGLVSRSDFVVYIVPWYIYVNALRADGKTSNDTSANASLPGAPLTSNVKPHSADGRAVGLNTPTAMFSDGTVGNGGPYDGIVTLNSGRPFQFSRPPSASNYDAQRATEHEIDEVIGLSSRLGHTGNDLHPQDLFSWSSPGVRNLTSSGVRYFSINGGVTNIVNFNQTPNFDLGDWLSTTCPLAHPYVQNAFGCPGQSSDIAASSPEGVNLDVIGYDLVGAPPVLQPTDFNNDRHPDYLLFNSTNRGTVIWYMNNYMHIASAAGPTIPAGWSVAGAADFNLDGHPDYLLFNSSNGGTVIWYMNNYRHIASAAGPTIPAFFGGIAAVADFNGDGHPDYLSFNPDTGGTFLSYLNNYILISSTSGPSVPGGWGIAGAADFNGDGHPDYLLFNASNRGTVIWYMNDSFRIGSAAGPTVPGGWSVVGAADFNLDGHPDFLLFNSSNGGTVIWYMNNYTRIGSAAGPTVPAGWRVAAP